MFYVCFYAMFLRSPKSSGGREPGCLSAQESNVELTLVAQMVGVNMFVKSISRVLRSPSWGHGICLRQNPHKSWIIWLLVMVGLHFSYFLIIPLDVSGLSILTLSWLSLSHLPSHILTDSFLLLELSRKIQENHVKRLFHVLVAPVPHETLQGAATKPVYIVSLWSFSEDFDVRILGDLADLCHGSVKPWPVCGSASDGNDRSDISLILSLVFMDHDTMIQIDIHMGARIP